MRYRNNISKKQIRKLHDQGRSHMTVKKEWHWKYQPIWWKDGNSSLLPGDADVAGRLPIQNINRTGLWNTSTCKHLLTRFNLWKMGQTPHTSYREICATGRARNIFLDLWRDGRYKLPVKNRRYIRFGYVTLRCNAVENIIEWRTASISTKMWLDFFARGYHLLREATSFP